VRSAQRSQLRQGGLRLERRPLRWVLFLGLLIAASSRFLGQALAIAARWRPSDVVVFIADGPPESGRSLADAPVGGGARPELSLHLLGGVELGGAQPSRDFFPASGPGPQKGAGGARRAAGPPPGGGRRAGPPRAPGSLERPPRRRVAGPIARGGSAPASGAETPHRPIGPVDRVPITGEVELTYRYPAYTGLAPRNVPGTKRGECAHRNRGRPKDGSTDVSRGSLLLNGIDTAPRERWTRAFRGASSPPSRAATTSSSLRARGGSWPRAGRPRSSGAGRPSQVVLLTPPQDWRCGQTSGSRSVPARDDCALRVSATCRLSFARGT